MPSIIDFLHREFCRARLSEMRRQLLLRPAKCEIEPDDKDGRGLDDCLRDARVTGKAPPDAKTAND